MLTVIGTANVDLLIDAPARPRQQGDEFTTESLVFCESPLRTILGGNGANSAYALARLGVPVRLGSAIGRDPLGALVERWLAEAGVDTSALLRSETAATASTTIIADADRNRVAYHHRGALAAFGPDDLPPSATETIDGVLLSSYPLLLGWGAAAAGRLFATARRRGAVTLLDVGPAVEPPARLGDLGPVLPLVDFLLCNEHELCVLAGTGDVDEAAARVRRAGAGYLVLKRGRAGATLFDASDAAPRHVPGFSTPVHSTVGAGDAFNAGFLCGIRRGWSLERAVRMGHAVAALVVRAPGGILSSPTLAEADAFLEQASSP